MKTISIACLTIFVLSYLICFAESIEMPVEQWKAFKSQHGKTYADDEDAKRFEIFQNNLKMIEEHNAKYKNGEVSFSMGINQFSDMLPEERKNMFGLIPDPNKK